MKQSKEKENESEKKIEIRCYFEDKSFNIIISEKENLYNLKHYIILNLASQGIYTYETNLNIRYGFPPKLINNEKSNTLTLPELSIFDKECLRIELIDPSLLKPKENELIDYSKYSIKKKDIPADNSCLFNAINFAINHNADSPELIRGIISSEIKSNPTEYNAAVLDKDPEDYCNWILKGDSWGGGIELSILSKFFQVQIGVVDIQHITIEYFGDYSNCIYLLYNNIHYDVFYKEENGEITGVFDSKDTKVKEEIMEVCKELKKNEKYVDTQTFSLKCMQCGFLMKGQDEVIEHTKKTGHINFNQI
jgi:ubiquitin thioesterase OTU1